MPHLCTSSGAELKILHAPSAGCLGFPAGLGQSRERLCSWLIIRSWAIKIHPVNSRKWRTLVRNGECATGRAQETHFHPLLAAVQGAMGGCWTKVERRPWGHVSSRGHTKWSFNITQSVYFPAFSLSLNLQEGWWRDALKAQSLSNLKFIGLLMFINKTMPTIS